VIRDGSKVVADSFLIAAYLEETYPDRPSLFGGEGGRGDGALCRILVPVHLARRAQRHRTQEIHDRLGPEDQAYFKPSREARLGKTFSNRWPRNATRRSPVFRPS
jgi:glutathione S-transferase